MYGVGLHGVRNLNNGVQTAFIIHLMYLGICRLKKLIGCFLPNAKTRRNRFRRVGLCRFGCRITCWQ